MERLMSEATSTFVVVLAFSVLGRILDDVMTVPRSRPGR